MPGRHPYYGGLTTVQRASAIWQGQTSSQIQMAGISKGNRIVPTLPFQQDVVTLLEHPYAVYCRNVLCGSNFALIDCFIDLCIRWILILRDVASSCCIIRHLFAPRANSCILMISLCLLP